MSTFTPHIGIDESGKGDFFGPLVICAIFIKSKEIEKQLKYIGVKDSKKIHNHNTIKNLSILIKKYIGIESIKIIKINPIKYNELYKKIKNLNNILAWGHRTALDKLQTSLLTLDIHCNLAISDRFSKQGIMPTNDYLKKFGKTKIIQTTKAEESYIAVAGASIIAKANFDQEILLLSQKHNIKLTKGSCNNTLQLTSEIIKKYGEKKLTSIAKIHFKILTKALQL